MALKINSNLYYYGIGRHFGGNNIINSVYLSRENSVGRFGHFSKLSAIPDGYLAPSSFAMPKVGGNMSSFTLARPKLTALVNMAGGVNLQASDSLTFEVFHAQLDRIIKMLASGVCELIGSGTMLAGATLLAQGQAQITSDANIGAIVTTIGTGNMSLIEDSFLSALANMEASGGGPTPLSPEALAKAVWETLASEFSDPATMGGAVNEVLASQGGGNTDALTLTQYIGLK